MNKFIGKGVFAFLILVVLFTSSCATKKHMVYFQSGDISNVDTVNIGYTPVFKVDDYISVIVSSDNTEATVPFNFPVQMNRTMSTNSGYSNGVPMDKGYLIDADGNVALPVLGKVKIGGMNRMDAISMLEKKYEEYLKNPVVNLQIQNYKITVLGDVLKPGTFKIPNERITILEAIGLAGDLRITGNRENVLVIREMDGKKIQYRLDFTSNDVLSSPVYYLQQNDVVYVEPNSAARSRGTFWRTTGSIFISITSLVVTTISIILN